MAPATQRTLQDRLATQTVLLDYISAGGMDHAHTQAEDEPALEADNHLNPADLRAPVPDEAHEGDHTKSAQAADDDHHSAPDPHATEEDEKHGASHSDMDEDLAALKTGAAALPAAPIEDLSEKGLNGLLPKTGPDGNTPFRAYRKPFTLNRDRPALAVVILDYGLSSALSEEILSALPSNISLVLNPYSSEAESWQKKARADGHEIWLSLPMETADFPASDPGAKAIMSRLSLKANQERLNWVLSRTTGYAGVAAFSDRTALKAETMFDSIGREIFKRGLGYLELSPARYSFYEPLAGEFNQPSVHNFIHLDFVAENSAAQSAIDAQIQSIGGAVVTVEPSLQNIAALQNWFSQLEAKGVQIVPVSAIAALSVEGI